MEKTKLKKQYTNAEAEVVKLEDRDIIVTSDETADGTNVPGDGWTS